MTVALFLENTRIASAKPSGAARKSATYYYATPAGHD
jgi:hypothetical protein